MKGPLNPDLQVGDIIMLLHMEGETSVTPGTVGVVKKIRNAIPLKTRYLSLSLKLKFPVLRNSLSGITKPAIDVPQVRNILRFIS